jgi:hypothetical protein
MVERGWKQEATLLYTAAERSKVQNLVHQHKIHQMMNRNARYVPMLDCDETTTPSKLIKGAVGTPDPSNRHLYQHHALEAPQSSTNLLLCSCE